MKFSYVGAMAALALTMLAGCGGKAQFVVGGTVTGLNNSGLVLANGSDTVAVPAGATSFAFPKQISYGTVYNITVQTQPAHMNCIVGAPTDSAGHTVTIQAQVQCTQNTYTLGGQFTGLFVNTDTTSRSVTLLNGTTGGVVTVSSPTDSTGRGDFTFGTLVADGQAYGVTIQSQPADVNCTLANGTGVLHDTAVSNLLLSCTPK